MTTMPQRYQSGPSPPGVPLRAVQVAPPSADLYRYPAPVNVFWAMAAYNVVPVESSARATLKAFEGKAPEPVPLAAAHVRPPSVDFTIGAGVAFVLPKPA